MARTLLELFEDSSSYKFGTNYNEAIGDKPKGSGFVANVRNYAEQEADGLRIQAAKSIVSLYGTEVVRITKQRTTLVDDMKKATGGEEEPSLLSKAFGGKIKDTVNKVKDKVSDVLGLPSTPIPTFVVKQGKEDPDMYSGKNGDEPDTMENLAKIRNDAAGSGLGKFLKQNAKGTPKQILTQGAGSALKAGKKVVRGALFGRQTTLGTADGNENGFEQLYGSGDKSYTAQSEEFIQPNAQISSLIDPEFELEDPTGRWTYLGGRYQSAGISGDVRNSSIAIGDSGLQKSINTDLPYSKLDKDGVENNYSKQISEAQYIQPDNTSTRMLDGLELKGETIHEGRPSDLDGTTNNWLDESKLKYSSYNTFNTKRKNDRDINYLENGEGYKYEATLKKIFHKGQVLKDENIDTIVVKIGSVRFHYAVISGISETFSPSWSSFKMVGSPFNAYTYDSIERSVSFTITLYPNNPKEHKENWDNIRRIISGTYPFDYIGIAGAVTPPITSLTLGDMYKNKPGFIESLTVSVDDESTWELGRGKTEIDEYEELFSKSHLRDGAPIKLKESDSVAYSAVQDLEEVKNYKLPKVVELQIGFQFIESRPVSETDGSRFESNPSPDSNTNRSSVPTGTNTVLAPR
jgi:hypothetical protein